MSCHRTSSCFALKNAPAYGTGGSYPHDEHFPPLLYPQFRNRSIWANASPNKWGSGIFSTSGVLSRITVPQYDGWVVGASIQNPDWRIDGDEILAFSLHAPNGEGRYTGQVNRILDMIAPLIDGRDVIIAGDFNLTISHFADEPTDKNNLEIQRRLTEEFGLMNCWMQANPDEPLHQTLRWTGNRATRYHCDGVFVPRKWKDQLKSCVVLSGEEWDDLSDHNPVLAKF